MADEKKLGLKIEPFIDEDAFVGDTNDMFRKLCEALFLKEDRPDRTLGRFWPSEASIKIKGKNTDIVIGTCARSLFWKMSNVKPSNLPSCKGQLRMSVGKYIESCFLNRLVDLERYYADSNLPETFLAEFKYLPASIDTKGLSKEEIADLMVPYKAKNYKFEFGILKNNEEFTISGEIDAMFYDSKGKLYIGEIKTYYGDEADLEITGSSFMRRGKVTPFPKTEHILQTLIYLDYFSRNADPNFKDVNKSCIFYINRGSGQRAQHILTVDQKGEIIVNGLPIPDEKAYLRGLTAEMIYERMAELMHMFNKGILPPREYSRVWTVEKAQDLFDLGLISKTALEDTIKKPTNRLPRGDWQCSYCSYKSLCYEHVSEEDIRSWDVI